MPIRKVITVIALAVCAIFPAGTNDYPTLAADSAAPHKISHSSGLYPMLVPEWGMGSRF